MVENRADENKDEITPPQKKDLTPALKLFSLILILRGLTDLVVPVIWNTPFDEFFLGPNATFLLSLLFIIAGAGIFFGKDWGYLIAFPACAIAFALESDSNAVERASGEILSLFMLIMFWNGWKQGKAKKTPKGELIAIAAILLLITVTAYDYGQPTAGEKYDYYSELAKRTKDPTICKNIGWNPSINQCLQDVAFSTKNASICDMIKDPIGKRGCYKYVTEST